MPVGKASPLREVISERRVSQRGGGPTRGAFFWALTLRCGHQVTRSAGAKPTGRVRCHVCGAQGG